MEKELLERVARAMCVAEAYPARDWREWTDMATTVLAELAGELRDAELARIYRHERDHQSAYAENLLNALTAIHMLAAPADVEVNDKIYRFTPQDPSIWIEAWREMSKRIREIPAAIAKARQTARTV
mgnify:CR=1 FL=1